MDPNLQVSLDAARKLEEFSDEFREALALDESFPLWAADAGLVRATNALKTTFPVPLDAAGYKKLKGDLKFRRLYSRSFSMTGELWADGVEEFAHVIEAPDFIDWAGAPARMAVEWRRLPNKMVADMLAQSSFAGPILGLYGDPDTGTASTKRMFASGHLFNLLDPSIGDFDNRLSVTEADILSGDAWDTITDHFRSIKGPNGESLGLSFTGGYCIVPPTHENLFKNALEFDTLIRSVGSGGEVNGGTRVAAVTQNNRYKGTFGYTVADELDPSGDEFFYAIASSKAGMYPWVVQQESSPEEIMHDKSSELYKRSFKVGVAYKGLANCAGAMPHVIARVEITG